MQEENQSLSIVGIAIPQFSLPYKQNTVVTISPDTLLIFGIAQISAFVLLKIS